MNRKFTVYAGPCVIEDEALVLSVAEQLKAQLDRLPIDFYFKASFDKANRSSIESFRGPGIQEGLRILKKVREDFGLKILTDFHLPGQAMAVAEIADCLQIPAFLCRQTDMIAAGVEACEKFDRQLNIKKGQFLAPWDAKNIIQKVREFSKKDRGQWFQMTERGVSFGYNRLIVDMAAFQSIQQEGVPVIYDATHSIQLPGAAAGGKSTGGQREFLEVLARASMAAGADGVFLECHPHPAQAKSDGANAFYLEHVGSFVKQLLEIRHLVSEMPKLLPEVQH